MTFLASGFEKVYAYAEFVGVVVGEVAATVYSPLPTCEGRCRTKHFDSAERLHPDHRCAVVGEIAGCEWPDGNPTKIQHFQPFEGAGLVYLLEAPRPFWVDVIAQDFLIVLAEIGGAASRAEGGAVDFMKEPG